MRYVGYILHALAHNFSLGLLIDCKKIKTNNLSVTLMGSHCRLHPVSIPLSRHELKQINMGFISRERFAVMHVGPRTSSHPSTQTHFSTMKLIMSAWLVEVHLILFLLYVGPTNTFGNKERRNETPANECKCIHPISSGFCEESQTRWKMKIIPHQ